MAERPIPAFAGILPGRQIGHNYQYGKWVFGIEGDAGWTNADGARACPNGFLFNCQIDVNSLYTVTGRVGYVYPDRVLWYAKGGLAIVPNKPVCLAGVEHGANPNREFALAWPAAPPRDHSKPA
jgi:opacity protein-like surface antigen